MKDWTKLKSYKQVQEVNKLREKLSVKKACQKVGMPVPYYYKMNKFFSAKTATETKTDRSWKKTSWEPKKQATDSVWAYAVTKGAYVVYCRTAEDLKALL